MLTSTPGWTAGDIADQLVDLEAMVDRSVALTPETRAASARLAKRHGLTFYDAAYWSVAEWLGGSLVTSDRDILEAGGGESPAALCRRIGLAPS